ncbi:hypothetical protein BDW71DRAFT_210760 [Aspergillus fruticulosus]
MQVDQGGVHGRLRGKDCAALDKTCPPSPDGKDRLCQEKDSECVKANGKSTSSRTAVDDCQKKEQECRSAPNAVPSFSATPSMTPTSLPLVGTTPSPAFTGAASQVAGFRTLMVGLLALALGLF